MSFQAADIAGAYQNALANSEKIKASQMQNALSAQEMQDMQAQREYEKSPEAMQKKQMAEQRDKQKAAIEDLKLNLPALGPDNWNKFGEYLQGQYGEAGVFAEPYNAEAHNSLLENFGIKKPERQQQERPMNDLDRARAEYLRAQANKNSGTGGGQPTVAPDGSVVPPMPAPKPGKAPTQDQANAATFGARADVADKIIAGLDDDYSPMGVSAQNTFGSAANWAISPNTQKASQAQRDFINAVLRKESGATISPEEFDNAKQQYFPQVGEGDEVKLQKAQNRAIAIQGLKNAAGPAAFDPNINPNVMGGQPAPSSQKRTITRAQLEDAAAKRFNGDIAAAYREAMARGYDIQ
jgi:hypothetical protein